MAKCAKNGCSRKTDGGMFCNYHQENDEDEYELQWSEQKRAEDDKEEDDSGEE